MSAQFGYTPAVNPDDEPPIIYCKCFFSQNRCFTLSYGRSWSHSVKTVARAHLINLAHSKGSPRDGLITLADLRRRRTGIVLSKSMEFEETFGTFFFEHIAIDEKPNAKRFVRKQDHNSNIIFYSMSSAMKGLRVLIHSWFEWWSQLDERWRYEIKIAMLKLVEILIV